MPYYPLFEMREVLKRSALMLHEEKRYLGGYPMLESHITDTTMVPLCSFNATLLDWEMNFGADPYPKRFSQEYILTNTLGNQVGALGCVIVQREKSLPGDEVERSVLAVQFANNIMSTKLYFTPGKPYQKVIDYIYDFGYEADDTKIYPGYAENNPVKTPCKNVLATVLKRQDGEVLLLIGNVSNKAVKGKFDLGKFVSGTICDAETAKIIGQGSSFELEVAKNSYRMIRIGQAPVKKTATFPVADWAKCNRARMQHTVNSIVLTDIKKDHQLLNRNLAVDPKLASTITIKYRAKGIPKRTRGQLYFAGDKQKFGSPRVFHLPSLKGDNKVHTITIKTAKNPEWKKLSKVTSIRLDLMDEVGEYIELLDFKLQ